MALAMKSRCEQCDRPLSLDGVAFICTYECTFCQGCTENLHQVCPNCGGELVRRPRRSASLEGSPEASDL